MMPPRLRPVALPMACALAYAGVVVGYTPLLALLVPAEVARVAGDDRYAALALVLAVGAVAAGAANWAFGWLSDRSRRRGGGRRRWIAAGLAGTLASFAALPAAHTVAAIVVVIALFQIALNAMLAPMMALVAEEVSANRTGLVTGLFAGGPVLAALVAMALAVPALQQVEARLAVIGATSAVCLLPLLAMPPVTGARPAALPPASGRRDLVLAWTARLLVQIAGTVLFADLLYLMEAPAAIGGSGGIARTGTLLLLANLLPAPVAVAAGRWSDRPARLRPLLFAAALAAAVGLAAMAGSTGSSARAAGFLVFAVGWGVFLPLQVGHVMRLLPDPDRLGRDLGVLNLANTVPVLIGQGLAWWLATPRDVTALLLALAGLTLVGGTLTLAVRPERARVSRTPRTR